MCKVSGKLKLCSCEAVNVTWLKHYWILKRHNGKDNCIVGQAMLPADIGDKADKINTLVLVNMLNNGNCFDIAMKHQQNDILELHFTFRADPKKHLMLPCYGNFLAYAFIFRNSKWKKTDFDPFGENLEDIQKGKIVNPFVKDPDSNVG